MRYCNRGHGIFVDVPVAVMFSLLQAPANGISIGVAVLALC